MLVSERDHVRNDLIGRAAAIGKSLFHAFAIGPGAILAHLALPLQRNDGHADTDNAAKLSLDVGFGSVSDCPR